MTIWIGPAGRLRKYDPEAANEPQLTDELIGGVHDGLTGSSTRDVWGRRSTWKLQWNRLLGIDHNYLTAAHRGDVGQVWLVDQLRRNRCRLQPIAWTSPDAAAARATVLQGDSGMDRGWLLTGAAAAARVWRSPVIPALPTAAAEQLLGAVCVSGAAGAELVVDALAVDAVTVLASSTASTAPDTAVRALSCPAPIAATAGFWQLRLTVPAAASAQVSEQQLLATPVSGFRPAGGSASVRLDDVTFSPTIPPFWAGSLTAREV